MNCGNISTTNITGGDPVTAIRRLREERGFSQQELAQALGVTQGAVSHWENGVRKPDIDDIVKIAQLFNCKVDDLIDK